MTLDQLSNLIKDPKLFGILIVRPFGLLLQWLYSIVQNYGLAVILFALLVKLVCIPLTIKSKKSMLAMSPSRGLPSGPQPCEGRTGAR